MLERLADIDGGILLFLQEVVRNPVLDPVMKVITTLGNAGIIWILITLLLFLSKKTRKVGWMSFSALLITLFLNNILIKNIVARPRPYYVIEALVPLIKKPREFSFPSGHAGSSFASACILFRKLPKKYGIWALVLATLISISRIYVGVHYPTDILAGMVTGIAYSFLGEWLVEAAGNVKNR